MNHVQNFLDESVKIGLKRRAFFGSPIELFSLNEERRHANMNREDRGIDYGEPGDQESRWMYRGVSDDYPETQGYDVHYENPVDCQTRAGFRRVLT